MELQSYLPSREAVLFKDRAERKISKLRLPKETNHIIDLAQLSKLPGKLFEKLASESDPAASKGLSKAGIWSL